MKEAKNFEFPIIAIGKEEYEVIHNWIESHKEMISGKSIYIFGAGIRGNMLLKLLEEAHIDVTGFCDNSMEKQGAFVKGYRIFSPSEICDKPEENYILISPENSGDIERMLEIKGYVKEKNYFVITNNCYVSYCNEFFRKENIEYIFFGDCYFTDLDVDDLHDKSMGEMVTGKIGIDRSKVLSIHGMCIPSFYYLMQMQIKLGIKPRAVAFIVNIPFCNSIQTKLPQSQHAELFKMIRAGLPMQDNEFNQYVGLTESRSRNINTKSFSTKNSIKNKDANYVEKLLTKTRYMYEFKEDNENIIYLKKMIELLKQHDIKPVPFIPALNYHIGIDFYGEDFTSRYCAICEKIKKCVEEYDVEILDMSFLLGKESYSGSRMTKFPNAEGKEKEISLLCDRTKV